MMFLAIISRRCSIFSNAVQRGALLIRVNRSRAAYFGASINFCKLVNGVHPQQTVDSLLLPKLCQWLDCSRSKAEEICSQLPKRKSLDVEEVEESYHLLKRNGVVSWIILDNPKLLHDPAEELRKKIQILHQIGFEQDTIPLLRLPRKYLAIVAIRWLDDAESFSKNAIHSNRLQFIADNLHCSSYQVAMLMDKHHPLLTMDFERLNRLTRLLLDCGISRENIRNDLWIFRHNEALMRERIEISTKAGVDPIKTWMLRCPETIYMNMLKNWCNKKKVLGIHEDVESYLAARLECSREDVVDLYKKYNRLCVISVPKLKLILDFLFESGFTAEQVCKAPRVLGHKVDTLAGRLEELKKLGYRANNLRLLFSTARQFKRFIDKIHQAKFGRTSKTINGFSDTTKQ